MTRMLLIVVSSFLLVAGHAVAQDGKKAEHALLYVGTYTGGKMDSKGIYYFKMDLKTGKLENLGVAAETPNPSFLALHPSAPYLYAVNEIGNYEKKSAGSVAAFKIDNATGKLTELNRQSTGGADPCHIVTDKAGKDVLVANYSGGSIACLPIKADGSLEPASTFIQHKGSSINPGNQKGPHAHSINLDAANKFAVAADLGTDHLYVYKFDPAKGLLTPNDPIGAKLKPGSGPRHFAFHPDGKHAFAINEISRTMTSFRYDADKGTLTEIETLSTLPDDAPAKGSTAEVVVHPSGKWVFGSNRGHNSIAVFSFDGAKEQMKRVGNFGDTVRTPRNFVVAPNGEFVLVANQDGHSITVFRLNEQTGELTRVGEPTACPSPVCLRFRN